MNEYTRAYKANVVIVIKLPYRFSVIVERQFLKSTVDDTFVQEREIPE